MPEILDSLIPVLENASFVSLNAEGIRAFADSLTEADITVSAIPADLIADGTDEDRVAFVIIWSAIVFSTWGEPKWGLTVDGKLLGGSASIMHAMRDAIVAGVPLTFPAYLAEMPLAELRAMLTAEHGVEIPLLKERLENLHALGSTVRDQFDGRFMNILKEADYSAPRIARLLIERLPSVFRDQVDYQGHTVQFHKLAQLAGLSLIELHENGALEPEITDEAGLTALSDYKVPQALESLGLIAYAPELAENLRDKVELPYGSQKELEIRAFTLKAIDEVVRLVKDRIPRVTATKVDSALWLHARTIKGGLPHHRTRTKWY